MTINEDVREAGTLSDRAADLYARLAAFGFDGAFVRGLALPDWWDDAIWDSGSGSMEGCMRLSRTLGLTLKSLWAVGAPLVPKEPWACHVLTGRLQNAWSGDERGEIIDGYEAIVARADATEVMP